VGFGIGPDSSTASFEARSDAPNASIHFAVICPETKEPTFVLGVIGRGWTPPKDPPFDPDVGKEVPRFGGDFAGPDKDK
jgi:hypothetical protein